MPFLRTSSPSNLAMIGSRDRSVGWYDPPITSVNQPVRELLEKYSLVPPDEVIPRIIKTVTPFFFNTPVIFCNLTPNLTIQRDTIWDVFPWPCVGQFRFLDLSMSRNPAYAQILDRLKHKQDRILDVGCCLAQDLRKLAYDGAPASSLFGLEKQAEFISIGYDFFGDRETLSDATFINADLFDRENEEVCKAVGTFGIVNLGMVLHIWDLEGQIRACQRVVELLRGEKGVMVVGQSVGDVVGKEVSSRGSRVIFKHDVQTFTIMWEEVGRRTGTRWEVEAALDEGLGIDKKKRYWDEPSTRRLSFRVERL